MCIKKNNPGCDPCEPCELLDCGTGVLSNTEVTISSTPATRQYTYRSGGVEYQVTYEGYDFINGTYNLTPDADCNYFNLIIGFDVDITVRWTSTLDPGACNCTGYDEGPITCTVPMELIISEGGISVSYNVLGGFSAATDCDTGTAFPNFLNQIWEFSITRNSSWCVEHDEELTISGGLCFTDCGDTATGVNVNWTPTIT